MPQYVRRLSLAKLFERVAAHEVRTGEIRCGYHGVARRRLVRLGRRIRQLEKAEQRQVFDAVTSRPGGAEVTQVNTIDVVLAHEIAEQQKSLPPIQARIREDLVIAVAVRAVLAHVGEEVREIRQREYDQPGSGSRDDKSELPPVALPDLRGGHGGYDRNQWQQRERVTEADVQLRAKQERGKNQRTDRRHAERRPEQLTYRLHAAAKIDHAERKQDVKTRRRLVQERDREVVPEALRGHFAQKEARRARGGHLLENEAQGVLVLGQSEVAAVDENEREVHWDCRERDGRDDAFPPVTVSATDGRFGRKQKDSRRRERNRAVLDAERQPDRGARTHRARGRWLAHRFIDAPQREEVGQRDRHIVVGDAAVRE